MESRATILYDDDCGVCSAFARFVERHDRKGAFRLLPLESEEGRTMRGEAGVGVDADSIVVVEAGKAVVRSDAVFAIMRRLGGAWHLLRIGEVLPRRMSDAAYDLIARNRGAISRRLGLRCKI